MQKVAQKRKAEPKHRHPNSRQLPVFISSDDIYDNAADYKQIQTFNAAKRPTQTKSDGACFQRDVTCLRTLASTYSTVLAKTNLHFLDLSLLTSVGVGRYTGQRLLESPQSISHFFKGRNWSYFQYIPLHYQQSVLISSATDCVLARVRCLLTPDDKKWELFALSSYSRALSKLQDAIYSTSQQITAEVLCSTLMLGLYEVSVSLADLWRCWLTGSFFFFLPAQLLNPSREDAWIKHTAGATYIIQLRGPLSYQSEFEKCLFMGHVGPMVSIVPLPSPNLPIKQRLNLSRQQKQYSIMKFVSLIIQHGKRSFCQLSPTILLCRKEVLWLSP